MIKVTICKVEHATREQARKLLPYIKDCNYYSVESPHFTEEECKSFEDRALKGLDGAKSAFLTSLLSDGGEIADRNFVEQELTYVYKNKIPLFLCERSGPGHEESSGASKRSEELMMLLLEGFYSSPLSLTLARHESIESSDKAETLERDKKIGQLLDTIEDRIRDRYSNAPRDINYTITIGGAHAPEKHTRQQVTVVDLMPEFDEFYKTFAAAEHEGVSGEEAERLKISRLIYVLQRNDIPHPITSPELLTKSKKELWAVLEEMKRTSRQ